MNDFGIDCGKVSKLINGLNPHKAHGHDEISIRIVKLMVMMGFLYEW